MAASLSNFPIENGWITEETLPITGGLREVLRNGSNRSGLEIGAAVTAFWRRDFIG